MGIANRLIERLNSAAGQIGYEVRRIPPPAPPAPVAEPPASPPEPPPAPAPRADYAPTCDVVDAAPRKGRSPRDGYARGCGIQYGDLRQQVRADPVYREALAMAEGRTIVSEDNRINLFLLLKFYLGQVPRGNIIEFGSYKGGNAIFLAQVARALHPGVRVYALDTFEGMPPTDYAIDVHHAGDFRDVDLDELRRHAAGLGLDNLEFVQGLFEDTAPALLPKAGPFALAHIDCDIYSAVCYAYDAVKPHMVAGGYYVFDDATYASCLGATEAVEDLLVRRDGLSSEQIFPHFVFRAPF